MLKKYDAIFVAMGTHKILRLQIPRDETQRVFSGIDFLRVANMGNSTLLGKKMTVIGRENTSIDVAKVAFRLGSFPLTLY